MGQEQSSGWLYSDKSMNVPVILPREVQLVAVPPLALS